MGLLIKKQESYCYLCGKLAETKDHIPPKGIFDDPRPTNLITVPACNVCNNSYATDDEYFRWFIATASAESQIAEKLIDNRILPRFRRRPALLNRIVAGFRQVDVYSDGGIWLGQSPAFKFDRPRIQRVVEKIVRGLYQYHTGHRLNDSYFVKEFVFNPKSPSEEIRKAVLSLPFGAVGKKGEVFCYHHWKHSKDNGITAWFLWFFMKTLILSLTDLRGRTWKIASG